MDYGRFPKTVDVFRNSRMYNVLIKNGGVKHLPLHVLTLLADVKGLHETEIAHDEAER